MRPTRVALSAAAAVLAPALLLSAPAFAAGPASPSATVTAVQADGGSDIPVDEMSDDDLRIAILRILADEDSGKRVVREANEALDNGTTEAMRAFLKTGYPLAQAEDDQVALFRILADPDSGKRVTKEVTALLETGTAPEIRQWLETGYRLAQAEDDQVALFRILARPDLGDAMRAAVIEVIDGTPEEMRYFLEYGQYEVDA
ncbi:ALF repeat-containing protein [Streptomyces sp. ML-6]|uniref:ALF repeat-containing protein n=1 Tax=Streptomyces sp. ML-6 TaxID=2982693 RepID=UPI0024C0CBC5|nr:ALF repeat-containing protein [Streptomyces sp. ML-6]MDK0518428.1 ALF repeat-containing protein [Streptomyces sp. ML-6]